MKSSLYQKYFLAEKNHIYVWTVFEEKLLKFVCAWIFLMWYLIYFCLFVKKCLCFIYLSNVYVMLNICTYVTIVFVKEEIQCIFHSLNFVQLFRRKGILISFSALEWNWKNKTWYYRTTWVVITLNIEMLR